MKNPEAVKLLKNCYTEGVYLIPVSTGCELIRLYIKELKEIDVGDINEPTDMFTLQLYNIAIDRVFTYYLTEETYE